MTNTLIGNKDKGIFLISILISLEENSSYLFKGQKLEFIFLREVYMSLFTKLLLG